MRVKKIVNTLPGMDERVIEKFWKDVAGFAAYSFNASHSCAYSMISYITAWIKAHYPAEFYVASMTTVINSGGKDADNKLSSLIADAGTMGIRIVPPCVNTATDSFLIIDEKRIMAPLSSVKGVSGNAARAIMEWREKETVVEKTTGRGKNKVTTTETYGPGPFKSIEDFRLRVPKNKVNSRAVESLNKVGAFVNLPEETDQLPVFSEDRHRDQIELMPGIMDQAVAAKRTIQIDAKMIKALKNNVQEYRDEAGIPELCSPAAGSQILTEVKKFKAPRFMVVLDSPYGSDEIEGFTRSRTFSEYIVPPLREAGLSRDDAFWTMLCRRPKEKGEREFAASEIAMWLPYLQKEIDLLKPPIILTLGSQTARSLVKDMKGSPTENCGKAFYNASMDASIIIGFNPGMIYHNPDKADELREIFERIRDLTM